MKLEYLYYLLAAIGFVLTGSQVLGYVDAGPVGGTIDFWDDALTTHDAARFLAFDVVVICAAVFVLMWVESRKVGIAATWFWTYVVLAVLVGASTFIPLFFAHRERAIAAAGSSA